MGVAILDQDRLADDVAELLEPQTERGDVGNVGRLSGHAEKADHCRLVVGLSQAADRGCQEHAHACGDELTPSHAVLLRAAGASDREPALLHRQWRDVVLQLGQAGCDLRSAPEFIGKS